MTYTLLVADDSVTIQRVIELTFAEEDVQVITVGDGQMAIDRLEADPPDIVLADVDMPKRDGYEVAAYVKSRPKLAHIPVVLLTGAFEPIDQARAEAAGSSDVLAKPFEPQMVINRVKQLLGRKREEELEVPPAQAPPQVMGGASAPRPPARSSMAMNDEHATQQDQPARPMPGQDAQEPVSLDDYFDQLDAAFSKLQPGSSPPPQHETMQAEAEWLDVQPEDLPLDLPEPLITLPPGPPLVNPDWEPEAPVVLAAPPPPPPPPPAPVMPQPLRAVAPPVLAVPVAAAAPPVAMPAPVAPVPAMPVAVPAPAAVVPAPVPAMPVAAPAPAVTVAAPVLVVPAPVPPAYVPPAPPAYVPPVLAPVAVAPPPPAAPAPAPVPLPRPAANPFAELSAAKAEAAARPPAPVITDEVIEEVVARVLQRLSDRVVRETVTEIVSKTAERLVQEEILRIKNEGQ